MGRFYETEKSRFVDDFIYKPNFQLMASIAGNEQKDYDTKLANAELMKKIDIRYIEDPVERARVKAIQDTYGNKIDNLANGLRNSKSMNWRQEFMPGIEGLKRELKADYDTGDIYKIQKSKSEFDKMNTTFDAKILDADTNQKYKKFYFEDWQKNKNRSGDKIFEYKEGFDKKNIAEGFLKSMKDNNVPQEVQTAYARLNSGYIDEGTRLTLKRNQKLISGLFNDYAESQQLKPYLKDMQKIKGETYFDENGELIPFDDPRSELFKASKFVSKELEIDNVKDTAHKKEDQNAMQKDRFAREDAKEAAAEKKAADQLAKEMDEEFQFKRYLESADGMEMTEKLNKTLQSYVPGLEGLNKKESELILNIKRSGNLGPDGGYLDLLDKQELGRIRAIREEKIQKYKETATPQQLRDLEVVEAVGNKKGVYGTKPFVTVFGDRKANEIQERMNTPRVLANLQNAKGQMEFAKSNGMPIFTESGLTQITGDSSREGGVSLETFKNRKTIQVYDDQGKEKTVEIKKAYIRPGYVSPMFTGDDNPGAKAFIIVEGKDGEEIQIGMNYKNVINFSIKEEIAKQGGTSKSSSKSTSKSIPKK